LVARTASTSVAIAFCDGRNQKRIMLRENGCNAVSTWNLSVHLLLYNSEWIFFREVADSFK
jgi:hypothetical protein